MATTYLIIAHLLADFNLQSKWLIDWKMRSTKGVLLHVAIFTIVACIFLFPYLGRWETWLVIGLISILHFVTDQIKIDIALKSDKYILPFIADQTIHFVSLIIGGYYLQTLDIKLPETYFYEAIYTNLYVVAAILVIIFSIYAVDIMFLQKTKPKKIKYRRLASFTFVYIFYVAAAFLLIG